jgi:LysR family glycine cleavage system transcriptional activator
MNKLPLNALHAWAVVYAHAGVRAAARELGIAHSAVSRHLAQLERWLGAPVIEKGAAGRRGLTLTPQGEALGKALLASFRDIDRAVSAVREARSPYSVTLSAAPSFASRWLLPRLPLLEAAHPAVELSIVVEQKPTDMDAGVADLAIRMGTGSWADVHAEALMDESVYPVMSPAYWQQTGWPDKPADLGRLRLLHDRDPQTAWEAWRGAFGPEALDVRSGPRFASADLLLRAAAQGQGVALARHRLAADDLESGHLIRPFGDLKLLLGTAYWIVRPRHGLPKPAAATVIAWLRQQAVHEAVTAAGRA